jgi:hypothetical protein
MDVVQAGETVLFRLNDDTTFFSVVDSKTYVHMAFSAPTFARVIYALIARSSSWFVATLLCAASAMCARGISPLIC